MVVWGPSLRSGSGRLVAPSRRSRGRKRCFLFYRAHPHVRDRSRPSMAFAAFAHPCAASTPPGFIYERSHPGFRVRLFLWPCGRASRNRVRPFLCGETPPLFNVWGPSLRSGSGRSVAPSRRSSGLAPASLAADPQIAFDVRPIQVGFAFLAFQW